MKILEMKTIVLELDEKKCRLKPSQNLAELASSVYNYSEF